MELEIKNANKQYGGTVVMNDFSLKFPTKGVVCFFGPSGCGKTTLLNCIAGIEPLDSGEIIGTRGQKFSYLFQEDRLLPWISAKENVSVVLRGSSRQNEREALSWLDAVGLAGEGDKKPAKLSGGMRQRVALARALAYGGSLYLLDEPFHALDEKTKREVMSLLQEKTPDSLKLFVTHDRSEAEALSNITYIFEGNPLKIIDTITK